MLAAGERYAHRPPLATNSGSESKLRSFMSVRIGSAGRRFVWSDWLAGPSSFLFLGPCRAQARHASVSEFRDDRILWHHSGSERGLTLSSQRPHNRDTDAPATSNDHQANEHLCVSDPFPSQVARKTSNDHQANEHLCP